MGEYVGTIPAEGVRQYQMPSPEPYAFSNVIKPRLFDIPEEVDDANKLVFPEKEDTLKAAEREAKFKLEQIRAAEEMRKQKIRDAELKAVEEEAARKLAKGKAAKKKAARNPADRKPADEDTKRQMADIKASEKEQQLITKNAKLQAPQEEVLEKDVDGKAVLTVEDEELQRRISEVKAAEEALEKALQKLKQAEINARAHAKLESTQCRAEGFNSQQGAAKFDTEVKAIQADAIQKSVSYKTAVKPTPLFEQAVIRAAVAEANRKIAEVKAEEEARRQKIKEAEIRAVQEEVTRKEAKAKAAMEKAEQEAVVLKAAEEEAKRKMAEVKAAEEARQQKLSDALRKAVEMGAEGKVGTGSSTKAGDEQGVTEPPLAEIEESEQALVDSIVEHLRETERQTDENEATNHKKSRSQAAKERAEGDASTAASAGQDSKDTQRRAVRPGLQIDEAALKAAEEEAERKLAEIKSAEEARQQKINDALHRAVQEEAALKEAKGQAAKERAEGDASTGASAGQDSKDTQRRAVRPGLQIDEAALKAAEEEAERKLAEIKSAEEARQQKINDALHRAVQEDLARKQLQRA